MAFKETILLRTRVAFLAVLLFAAAILIKLVYIQLLQGSRWKKAAEANSLEYRPIKATRGNIYADDGSLLATSLPFYRVALDPCIIDETTYQEKIGELSQLLANFYKDKSAEAYQKLIHDARKTKRRYLLINKVQVDYSTKKAMSQWPIFCQGRLRGGVIFEKVEKRFKPFQNLAFRTLGFVNEDECGAGLEYSFHQALKGVNGSALYQKTVGGNWKMIYNGSVKRPVHGYDIETTIDINLQDVAHSSLHQALHASQAEHGCAVVMEVKTGAIKAMVNLSQKTDGQYEELYNYAFGNQGTAEPGSTFKLASMLALLEETNMALTDMIDTGDGRFQFHGCTLKDVKAGGYGEITLQEVFEKSSNVIARLIQDTFGDNPQKFIDYLYRLGLSKPLGFQMAGEGMPFIQTPQSQGWSKITLPWMSIGYALKITPLQTLTLYNAIANNGKMVQPIIVKKIKQANRTIETFQGAVLNKQVCSKATLQKLTTMLEGVVERGNASRFKHGFYKIAGKSGTANKPVDGKYTNDTYVTFVGYFPAQAPQYSCIVFMDKPKNYAWHYGAAVAAVVKDIADKIAAQDLASQDFLGTPNSVVHLGAPLIRTGKREDLCYLCAMLNVRYHNKDVTAEWVRSFTEAEQIVWKPNDQFDARQVPYVYGMTLKDALYLLENHGLKVILQGKKAGRVQTQSLLPGTKVVQGQSILIQLT